MSDCVEGFIQIEINSQLGIFDQEICIQKQGKQEFDEEQNDVEKIQIVGQIPKQMI